MLVLVNGLSKRENQEIDYLLSPVSTYSLSIRSSNWFMERVIDGHDDELSERVIEPSLFDPFHENSFIQSDLER